MTENAADLQTDTHPAVSDDAGTQAGLVSAGVLDMFGLKGQPFAAEITDGEWYSDETTREQLVDIKEALISGDDLLLVSGLTGAGKSVLLKQLSTSGGTRIQCFSVKGSERFSTFNLFSGLLEAFKLKPPGDLKDTLKEVIPCLQALSERNMLGVIVLDDADRITDEELSLLLGSVQYLNSGEDPLLRILLAAQPEFESRIPELLPTSSDLPYASLAIEPFDIGRAAGYLSFRLNKVGEFDEFPFSEVQMNTICESAGGLPSGLNIAAAAEINNLYQSSPPAGDEFEVVEKRPILQNRPLKFALGALGTGLILASLYLFISPGIDSSPDTDYEIVSKLAIDTSKAESTSGNEAKQPERIALVQEPKTDLLPGPANESSEITAETVTESATESLVTTAPTVTEEAIALNDSKADGQSVSEEPSQAGDIAAGVSAAASPSSTSEDAATKTITSTTTATTITREPTAESAPNIQNDPPVESAATAAPEAAAATAGDTEEAALSGELLESANWVLVQDPELYTVQMSASQQRESVEKFLVRSKLNGPNSIFSFKRGDRTWYALVHGLYPTITEARNAIESMPVAAKSNQPWIRAIAQIQNSVKNK